MAKRHVKSLLIIMLALVCGFSLVSCSGLRNKFVDSGKENDVPTVEVTKGEFINCLVEKLSFLNDEATDDCVFNDISGHKYEDSIRLAAKYGIIETSGDSFFPDSAATREFSVTAAIKSLGYIPDASLSCTDDLAIDDPKYACLAVDLEMLSLENNCFLPAKSLSYEECDKIMSVVDSTLNSISGPDGTERGVLYSEKVILLDESESEILYEDKETGAVILTRSDKISHLAIGDIIVLSNGYSYKIVNFEYVEGSVAIQYAEPEIHEIFEYLDIAGEAALEGFELNAADGVTVEEITNEVSPLGAEDGGTVNLPDIDKKYKFSVNIGKAKVDVILTQKINSVKYKFDIEKVDGKTQINDFYIIFDKEDELTASIVREKEIKGTNAQGKWRLATYTYGGIRHSSGTFIGLAGFSVDLNIVISAEGSIGLTVESKGPVGFQILNGRSRYINKVKTKCEGLSLTGEFEIGPELEFTAYLLRLKLMTANISLTAGASASVKVQGIDPLFFCVDGELGVYLNVGKSFIGSSTYPGSKEDGSFSNGYRWNINKSPFHCENFTKLVEKCTWEEDEPDDDKPPQLEDPEDPDNPDFYDNTVGTIVIRYNFLEEVHSEIQYQTDLFLSYFLNKDSTPSFEQTYHRQSAIVSPEGPTDDDPMGVVVHNPDCNLTFKNIPVGFYTADIGFYGNILTKYDPNGSSNIYDLFTITAMNEDELSDNNMEYDESRYILEHFILLKPGATVYIDIIEYEIGRYRLEIDSSVLVHVSIVNEYITSE